VLAKTLRMINTTEATLASLNLQDDSLSPVVAHDVWKQAEETFIALV
jgi:hypothetical protein